MKTQRITAAVIGILLLGVLTTFGLAANPLDATVTINAATSLTVTEASVDFGSLAGFTSGAQAPVTLNVNARTNRKNGYEVTVSATDFSTLDGDAITFPLSTMEFSNDGGSTYTAFTTADQTVHTGGKTGPAGDDFTVPVRLNLSGNEAAGTYTSTITFTITAL